MRAGLAALVVALVVALVAAWVAVALPGTAMPAAAARETHTVELRPVLAQLPEAAPKSRQTRAEADALASCDPARLATINNVGATPHRKLRPDACAIVSADVGVEKIDRLVVGPTRVDAEGLKGVEQRFQNGYVIHLTLTPRALAEFNRLAAESLGQVPPRNEVAIVIDGVAVSAPAFQESHFDGPIQISGNFSRAQVQQLVAKIKSACDC